MMSIGFACVILIVIAPLGSRGEQPFPLSVAIVAKKSELLVGEPLHVQLVFRNEGVEAMRLWRSPDLGNIWVSADGERYEMFEDRMRPRGRMLPVLLAPGESVTADFVVFYRGKNWGDDSETTPVGYVFPQAGQYYVFGGYQESGQIKARSEHIVVTVKEAEAEERVPFSVLFPMQEYGRLMQMQGGDLSTKAKIQFEEAIARHPRSVYAPYLALALGRHYQQCAWAIPLGGGDAERTRYLQRAREYFELAAHMQQVPWVREEAMLNWAALAGEAEGVAIARQALLEFPNGQFRERFEFLLAKAARVKPRDPVDDAARELEALGYDLGLEDVTDEQVIEMTEFAFRSLERDYLEGKISYEQMRGEQARRYREWVMKNLKPVCPPQTDNVGGVVVPLE